MDRSLPTSETLKRLPLRAVVAYAARMARRVSVAFRGVVADEVLDEFLRLLDGPLAGEFLYDDDGTSIVAGAEGVVAAYCEAPLTARSAEKLLLLFSLVYAALAAMHAITAAGNAQLARHEADQAAEFAERTVSSASFLGGNEAIVAMDAAREDFARLLRVYGLHDEILLGDRVTCFEE